ncbi:MAG: fused MFS/spermidine synthase [Bacteroidota bacterium]
MTNNRLHGLVALLFIVSGATGLVYQIVWFKYLSLFLGNTTYAQTIVVATFMGGLAIGAAFWGRKADVSTKLLSVYGWLELAVGLYCFFYPTFLQQVKLLFIRTVIGLDLSPDGSPVLWLKLLVSLLTLLFPTILMGGSLPILVRFLSRHVEESGKNVATLYFLNSFGAVVGSLLAGFFLIRLVGLRATIDGAAVLNVLIGLVALYLGRVRIQNSGSEVPMLAETAEARIFTRRQAQMAITVAGISGFAAMIYEIAWVRLLIPVLGSSTYSFSLMVVGFISGITLGSYIVSSSITRIRNLFGFLGLCQLGVVLSMVATIPLYARIPYSFWTVAHILTRSDSTYPIFLSIQFVAGLLIMIGPTIFLGMSLPVATRISVHALEALGSSVGRTFSVNTLGTVGGSLIAGLILIPTVGVKHTIELAVAMNLGAGLLVVFADDSISRVRRYSTTGIMGLLVVLYLVFVPNWSHGTMLSGVFRQINRNTPPPRSYAEFSTSSEHTDVLYYKEGTTATVGVVESESFDGRQLVLIINGKADASSRADLPTQILLGQLPALLHPNPEHALVIGLGSGVTAGSILTHPVKFLDCVEISPEVVEASSLFDNVNNKPLQDQRLRLHIQDALAYLKLTQERYDIIVSEPSNPWIAGIGSLYTTEFFEECKKRMQTGGLMVQWLHLYEIDDETFKLVVRTFASSFSEVTVWQPMSSDVILIGSVGHQEIDADLLRSSFEQEPVKRDLSRILISDAPTLLSLQTLSNQSVTQFAGGGQTNTEDHPLLEYNAPKAFFVNRGVAELGKFDERMRLAGQNIFLARPDIRSRLNDREWYNIGFFHTALNRGNPVLGSTLLSKYIQRHPRDVAAVRRFAEVSERLGRTEEALRARKTLAELEPDNPRALEEFAWMKYLHDRNAANAFMPMNTEESEKLLRKCVELTKDSVDRFRVRLADIFFGTQQYAKAVDQYARALQIRGDYAPTSSIRQDVLLLQLAKCLRYLGKNGQAVGYAWQAVRANPENEEARTLVYDIWSGVGGARADSTSKKP